MYVVYIGCFVAFCVSMLRPFHISCTLCIVYPMYVACLVRIVCCIAGIVCILCMLCILANLGILCESHAFVAYI